jgi:hypothetical protein
MLEFGILSVGSRGASWLGVRVGQFRVVVGLMSHAAG